MQTTKWAKCHSCFWSSTSPRFFLIIIITQWTVEKGKAQICTARKRSNDGMDYYYSIINDYYSHLEVSFRSKGISCSENFTTGFGLGFVKGYS